jgi:5-methylcytosine-specific restriction enzyme subunit McrC
MSCSVCDCSPLMPQPDSAQAAWLRRLAASVCHNDLVIPMSFHREDDQPIVYCERDGTWWAGRYVGTIEFEGKRLTLLPRFGLATLRHWLFEATSVVLVDTPGQLREDETFIAQLLASVWVHGLINAARHGLPALRYELSSQGAVIRGRLGVAASMHLFARKSPEVISIRSAKTLDHAASEAIVAAYDVLRRWLPDDSWLPPRAKELLPQLRAVTGARPRVPTKAELDRIRYTPITAGFAQIAELSRQIANRRGLSAEVNTSGQAKGVLLDVAELWELHVLRSLRQLGLPWIVKHGTRELHVSQKLLTSEVSGQELGTLIPDALLYQASVIKGIVDAKYKSIHPTAYTPWGPQREDLYQMVAYLSSYHGSEDQKAWGILAYPENPEMDSLAPAEANSPWRFDSDKRIAFVAIPHDVTMATRKLQGWLEQLQ